MGNDQQKHNEWRRTKSATEPKWSARQRETYKAWYAAKKLADPDYFARIARRGYLRRRPMPSVSRRRWTLNPEVLKTKVIAERKEAGCQRCGFNDPRALHFHHLNPQTKRFTIGDFNGSLRRLVTELRTCLVLCANCHAIEHSGAKFDAKPREPAEIEAPDLFGLSRAVEPRS